jgi:DNA-directed RNA polymerase subunit RPC12/RpoP
MKTIISLKKEIRCPNCDYEGKGKWVGLPLGQNIFYCLLALMFFWTIIAPLLYLGWYVKNFGRNICPDCGNKMIVVKKKK